MPHYRVRLDLQGPISTPLESGTLFGHLCWALRLADGEEQLSGWLKQLHDAPFRISDGLPAGYLPRPVLPAAGPIPRNLEEADRFKKRKKREWVSLKAFFAVRGMLTPERLDQAEDAQPERMISHRIAHNRIDRRTGSTPKEGGEGGLYFVDEQWPREPGSASFDVYVQTEESSHRVRQLLEITGLMGYGKDATLGRGHFTVQVHPADRSLFEMPGNRWMSLSRGVLSENMLDPRYRVETRYGRLGGLYAVDGQPSKLPVTLTRPGATFRADGPGPFGALLKEIHPRRPEVVENAWHLVVPYVENDSQGNSHGR